MHTHQKADGLERAVGPSTQRGQESDSSHCSPSRDAAADGSDWWAFREEGIFLLTVPLNVVGSHSAVGVAQRGLGGWEARRVTPQVALEERRSGPAAANMRLVLAGARAPVEALSTHFNGSTRVKCGSPTSKGKEASGSRPRGYSPQNKVPGPASTGGGLRGAPRARGPAPPQKVCRTRNGKHRTPKLGLNPKDRHSPLQGQRGNGLSIKSGCS